MITIHTPNTLDFSDNGLGILEPMSCVLSVAINGAWSLELEHPFDEDEKYKRIEKNNIIKVTDIPIIREQTSTYQLFRIYDTVRTLSSVRAIAFPVAFEATYDAIIEELNITKKSATAALQDIMTYLSAHGVSKYTVTSDYTQQGVTIRQKKGKWASTNLIAAISGSDDGSIINKWGGEVAYDNYHIIVNGRLGSTTDYDLRYGKNLTGLSVDVDTSGVVTRFYPVSSDNVRFKKTVNNAEVGYVQSPDHFDDYPFARSAFVQAPYNLIDTTWEVGEPHSDTQIKTHEAIEALTENIEDVAQDLWSKLNHGQEWHNKWYEPEWVQSILNDAIAQCQKDITADVTHPTWKSVIQSCIKEGLSYIKNQEIPDFYWEEETVDNEKVYFYTNGQRYITNQYYYVDKKYCKFNSAGNYEPPADEPTFDWIQKKGSNSAKKFGNNKHYMAHNEDVYITMNGTLVRYYMDDEGWYDNNEDESDWTKHNWGTSSAWFGEEGATESDTGKYAHDTWLFIDGTYYYFNSKGYVTDQKNDYRWDWVEDKEKYWFGNKIDHEYGAVYVTNQWLKIDGEWHKFKADGTLTNMKQLKNQFVTLLSTNLATAITETIDHHQGYLYSTLYEQMEDYCEQLFEEGADVPVVNVTANLVDLSRTAEYNDIFESDNTLKSIRLGDDVMLRDFVHQIYDKKHAPNEPEYKDEVEERVVGLKYDCIKGCNTEVTISDPYKQFIIKTSGKASTKHYDTLQGGNVALGSISSTIGLIAGENIQIDENGVIRAFGEVGDVFAGTQVSYSPSITSGTLLGTIYINGVEYGIYSDGGGSDVDVTSYFSEGHKIAKIEVDDTSTDIYSPIDISYGQSRPSGGRNREFYNRLELKSGYDTEVYEYDPSRTGELISGTVTSGDTYSYYTGDMDKVTSLYYIDITQTNPQGLLTMAGHPDIETQGTDKHNAHGILLTGSSDERYEGYTSAFKNLIKIPKYFTVNGNGYATQNYKHVYVFVDDSDSHGRNRYVYITNGYVQLNNMRISSGADGGVDVYASETGIMFILDIDWNLQSIYIPQDVQQYPPTGANMLRLSELYYQLLYTNASVRAVERSSSDGYDSWQSLAFQMNYLMPQEYNGSAYLRIKNIYVKKGDKWVKDSFAPFDLADSKLLGVRLNSTQYNNLSSDEKNDQRKLYFVKDEGATEVETDLLVNDYYLMNEGAMTITKNVIPNTLSFAWNGGGYIGAQAVHTPKIPASVEKIRFKITTGNTSYSTTNDRFKIAVGVKAAYNISSYSAPNDQDWLARSDMFATRNSVFEGEIDLSNISQDSYLYIEGHGWNMTVDYIKTVTTETRISKRIMYRDDEYLGGGGGLSKESLYSAVTYASTINLEASYKNYDFILIETYNTNDKKNQSTMLSVSDLASGSYVGIDGYLLYTITNSTTLTFHDDFDDTNHSRFIKAVYGMKASDSSSGGGGSDNSVLDVEVDGVSVTNDRIANILLPTFTGATAQANGSKGQVPPPQIADKDKYLKGDGTWDTPSGGQTYTAGENINIDANNVISATDTTYNDYDGSEHGLVAPPSTTGSGRYLKEDGTWDTPSGGGGTTVVANPSGTATAELEKLQVGNDIYSIPSGGGGGGVDLSLRNNWDIFTDFSGYSPSPLNPNEKRKDIAVFSKSSMNATGRQLILEDFTIEAMDANGDTVSLDVTVSGYDDSGTLISVNYIATNNTSVAVTLMGYYASFSSPKAGSGGGSGSSVVAISRADYDLLPQADKMADVLYLISETVTESEWMFATNASNSTWSGFDYPSNKMGKLYVFTSFNGSTWAGFVYDIATNTTREATAQEVAKCAQLQGYNAGTTTTTTLTTTTPKKPYMYWRNAVNNADTFYLEDLDTNARVKCNYAQCIAHLYYTKANYQVNEIRYHDVVYSHYEE